MATTTTASARLDVPATVSGAVSLPSKSQLEYLISQTPACLLRPLAFFVSWNGVLTLAYSGFPPALAALKQQVGDTVAGLPAENPGSRWPKTSLAALHDRARLTPEQLERLNAICREESAKLSQEAAEQAVHVDSLSVVFYECRCLERRLLEHRVPLAASRLDPAQPDRVEQERVRGVVAEAEAPDYWFAASRDGSREAHYRGSALGVTLVHDLAVFQPGAGAALNASGAAAYGSALPGLVRAFRERVEAELPGLYRWFAEPSLHSTVRGLMG